jgi:hypothetical protein
MGIKLIKKESAEPKGHWVVYLRGEEWCTRDTEKEAQAVVNSYDGEGDCWYEFVADEAKNTPALNAATFAEPSFDAVTYGLEEISKNDSGEIEIVDGIDSGDSAQALADEVTALHKKHPEKKYHIIAIGTDSDGIADKSEVIWSDYPEEVSADENAPVKNEGRVTSYFVLHKNAELKAIDKIVATLEDAILNNQTVETTANPDGTVSIEIYGRMSPDEVARAIQLPGQLSTSYVDLAINIEG